MTKDQTCPLQTAGIKWLLDVGSTNAWPRLLASVNTILKYVPDPELHVERNKASAATAYQVCFLHFPQLWVLRTLPNDLLHTISEFSYSLVTR